MDQLDRVKQPVLLKFPDKNSRRDAHPGNQGQDRRQSPAKGGKKLPESTRVTPEERQELIIRAANNISSFVQHLSRELRFSIDGDNVLGGGVSVWDQNTNQLIRHIPASEVLKVSKRLEEELGDDTRGILIDSEV